MVTPQELSNHPLESNKQEKRNLVEALPPQAEETTDETDEEGFRQGYLHKQHG